MQHSQWSKHALSVIKCSQRTAWKSSLCARAAPPYASWARQHSASAQTIFFPSCAPAWASGSASAQTKMHTATRSPCLLPRNEIALSRQSAACLRRSSKRSCDLPGSGPKSRHSVRAYPMLNENM
jgi:hypothetical protein